MLNFAKVESTDFFVLFLTRKRWANFPEMAGEGLSGGRTSDQRWTEWRADRTQPAWLHRDCGPGGLGQQPVRRRRLGEGG